MSVPAGPPCSTGCTPASRAARSSCASKTPTRPATAPEHIEGILRALQWLGLDWDEGPYFQSQRGRAVRRGHREAAGLGSRLRLRLHARGGGDPGSPAGRQVLQLRRLLPGPGPGAASGAPGAVPDARRRARPALTTWSAAPSPWTTTEIEDFGVRKSNGDPLFILANVVDDADMGITHVIRGEDHVTNTTKYVLLWQALGYGPRPTFAHLPLLLQRRPQEALQAPGQGGRRGLPGRGLPARGHAQLSGPAGLVPRGQPGDPDPRRDGRRVPPRGRQERRGHLRRAQAAVGQRRVPASALRPPSWSSGPRPGCATRWEPLAPSVQERARTLADVYA